MSWSDQSSRLRLLLTWDPEQRPAPVNLQRSTLPQFSLLYMSLNYIWVLEGEDCLFRSSSESSRSKFYREQYRDIVIAFSWLILITTLSQYSSKKSLLTLYSAYHPHRMYELLFDLLDETVSVEIPILRPTSTREIHLSIS